MRKKINIFIASFIFATILWGSISLSDVYFTNVDVKLALVNLPQGYTIGTPLPEKINVRVRGQGWKLVSINVGPETEFRVAGLGSTAVEAGCDTRPERIARCTSRCRSCTPAHPG